jgi:hypothetical protein
MTTLKRYRWRRGIIDSELLNRYQAAFGMTFNPALWDRRPGGTVDAMMRRALSGDGPPVTDELIARELERRETPPGDF